MKGDEIIAQADIEKKIHLVRGEQVLLDEDIAEFYGVEIKRLNEQVKRNWERFPDDFCFQLTDNEYLPIRSQKATLKGTGKHRKYLPYVFTEEGVAAVSAIIKNEKAAKVSVQIMRAFVKMRRFLIQNMNLFEKINQIELKQLQADQKFEQIFKALENTQEPQEKGIFFDGQIFDAYAFITKLIKSANNELIIIDNYIDESVLTLLSKRKPGVKVCIYTRNISKTLLLDLQKYNSQFPTVEIKTFNKSHDRFLIIDSKQLFHFGASLKDLGKNWFAFSKMNDFLPHVLQNLKNVVATQIN